MPYVRISTPEVSYVFEADSTPEALDLFAVKAGYDDFEDLAKAYGRNIDDAEAHLTIHHPDADELIEEIVDEAMASNILEDWARAPFRTVEAWVAWCVDGKDGDAARAIAAKHGIDASELVDALRQALSKRELSDINLPFEKVARDMVSTSDTIREVRDALMEVHAVIGDEGMAAWFRKGLGPEVPAFADEPDDVHRFAWSWDDKQILVQEETSSAFALYYKDRED